MTHCNKTNVNWINKINFCSTLFESSKHLKCYSTHKFPSKFAISIQLKQIRNWWVYFESNLLLLLYSCGKLVSKISSQHFLVLQSHFQVLIVELGKYYLTGFSNVSSRLYFIGICETGLMNLTKGFDEFTR